MNLKEKLTNDMKTAMKAKEEGKETLQSIRLITAAIKNVEIEKRAELSNEDIQGLIQKEIKQTKESLEAYQSKGGYEEKVGELSRRVELLETYLPKQMTEAEISELVSSLINELGINDKSQKGKLMGVLMPKVKGRAEGKLVNQVVSNVLQ